MNRRNRIFLGILLLYAAGVAWLLWQLLGDIDPRYRESAEESLVETAHLMATLVEQRSAAAQEARAELARAQGTTAEAVALFERARAAEAAASALHAAAAESAASAASAAARAAAAAASAQEAAAAAIAAASSSIASAPSVSTPSVSAPAASMPPGPSAGALSPPSPARAVAAAIAAAASAALEQAKGAAAAALGTLKGAPTGAAASGASASSPAVAQTSTGTAASPAASAPLAASAPAAASSPGAAASAPDAAASAPDTAGSAPGADTTALDTSGLDALFRSLYARHPDADIFGLHKDRIELRVTVVDARGLVRFDSTGRHLGEDHGRWRDVRRALDGQYGARTSADIDGDPRTSVMYVAAPVRALAADGSETIIGAVSVGKPVQAFGQFVEAARRKTLLVGLTSVGAVLLLAVGLSVWLVRPVGLVADYVRYVRAQPHISPWRLLRGALGLLRATFDEMRDLLAGRSYVADYVQTLTHELKSPLSAIRGAAELLHEGDMPAEDRARFLANIGRETQRIQELVDRMMELARLERRRGLDHPQPVAMQPLLRELAASAEAAGASRQVRVTLEAPEDATVVGEAFLLRRAISNLLDNALDFSPAGGEVRLALAVRRRMVEVTVRDHGPGLPDFAEAKVFEKFFSTARPHSQRRGTGLGLPFVKQIAELHQGRVSLANAPGGGAVATVSLPRGD